MSSEKTRKFTVNKKSIEWIIKIFFLIGYILVEFVFENEEKSYYYELESLVLLSIIFFGSFYCYHVCPWGIIQELFGKLGKKLLGKHYNKIQIPDKYDKRLRYLKYIFAAYFIYVIISPNGIRYLGDHEEMYQFDYFTMAFIAIKFLAVSIVAMFFSRFFCRYMCYQKAIYNLLEKTSPVKIERDENACISCGKCDRACPMSIKVSSHKIIKSDKDCISCYHCIDSCPQEYSALNLKVGKKKVRTLKFIVYAAVIYYILSWIWHLIPVESYLTF